MDHDTRPVVLDFGIRLGPRARCETGLIRLVLLAMAQKSKVKDNLSNIQNVNISGLAKVISDQACLLRRWEYVIHLPSGATECVASEIRLAMITIIAATKQKDLRTATKI